MTSAWFRICRSKSCPDLSRCFGLGDNRLNLHGDGAYKTAVDELVLSFPQRIGWVGRGDGVLGDCRRRRWCGAVEMASEVIPVKQGMNLKTPHHIVAGC